MVAIKPVHVTLPSDSVMRFNEASQYIWNIPADIRKSSPVPDSKLAEGRRSSMTETETERKAREAADKKEREEYEENPEKWRREHPNKLPPGYSDDIRDTLYKESESLPQSVQAYLNSLRKQNLVVTTIPSSTNPLGVNPINGNTEIQKFPLTQTFS
jgi:hypothetical protein